LVKMQWPSLQTPNPTKQTPATKVPPVGSRSLPVTSSCLCSLLYRAVDGLCAREANIDRRSRCAFSEDAEALAFKPVLSFSKDRNDAEGRNSRLGHEVASGSVASLQEIVDTLLLGLPLLSVVCGNTHSNILRLAPFVIRTRTPDTHNGPS